MDLVNMAKQIRRVLLLLDKHDANEGKQHTGKTRSRLGEQANSTNTNS